MSGSMSSNANSNTVAGVEKIDVNFSLFKYVTVIERREKRVRMLGGSETTATSFILHLTLVFLLIY